MDSLESAGERSGESGTKSICILPVLGHVGVYAVKIFIWSVLEQVVCPPRSKNALRHLEGSACFVPM